jgi:hypothetical protein
MMYSIGTSLQNAIRSEVHAIETYDDERNQYCQNKLQYKTKKQIS